MSESFIERKERENLYWFDEHDWVIRSPSCATMTDEKLVTLINSLRAENADLKSKLAAIIAPVESGGGIEAHLKAENERLREALMPFASEGWESLPASIGEVIYEFHGPLATLQFRKSDLAKARRALEQSDE